MFESKTAEAEKNIIIKFTQLASLFATIDWEWKTLQASNGKEGEGKNYLRDLNNIKLLAFILLFLLLALLFMVMDCNIL